MPQSSIVNSKDGIEWYVERQGSGPDLVLIPSGEGDCESFAKTAALLSTSFTVTTMDMPGMSRTKAPPAAVSNVTWSLLADQIVGLMDALGIPEATFYGCSSGACAILCLVRDHTQRVRSGIIHEAPLHLLPFLQPLPTLPDASIIKACQEAFSHSFVADYAAWEALGPSYHGRLEQNFVTWIRGYIPDFQNTTWSKEVLIRRPITWSVGALTPLGYFYDNVVTATRAGIDVTLLDCMHFPQVDIPQALADHVRAAALKAL